MLEGCYICSPPDVILFDTYVMQYREEEKNTSPGCHNRIIRQNVSPLEGLVIAVGLCGILNPDLISLTKG